MMAVNGGSTPVSLVCQGADVLMVILEELQVDCSGRRCKNSMEKKKEKREEAGPLLSFVN